MPVHSPSRRASLRIAAVVAAIGFGMVWLLFNQRATDTPAPLVVYCAHDAVFAEDVLRDFEQHTGIPVLVKYDSEATKSLGFVNLLLQEREHPQCDVFWNNELLGMCELQDQGVLQPYRGPGYERIPRRYKDPDGCWAGFAARMRVFIVNTTQMAADSQAIETRLESGDDLTRVAIAQPLFGTTLTQYTVLWDVWGAERLQAWHRRLRKHGIREVKGNSATRDLVAQGACDFAFTDNDDFFGARDAGHPVAMLPVRVGNQTICIPNSVAIIRGTARLDAAGKLVDYLLSEEVELRLARSESRQIPLGPVAAAEIPEDVRPLVEWAQSGVDLRDLLPARRAVIEWLKSEYLR